MMRFLEVERLLCRLLEKKFQNLNVLIFSLHLFCFASPNRPDVHFMHIGLTLRLRYVEIGSRLLEIIAKIFLFMSIGLFKGLLIIYTFGYFNSKLIARKSEHPKNSVFVLKI